MSARLRAIRAFSATATIALLLVACGSAATPAPPSPSPSPNPNPTPTPITAPVQSPEDAAALVIARDALFTGAIPLTQDVIGASKWWTATPRAGGGYTIELTVGWGDCPAGCINRHVWTFDVAADGAVTLTSERGDEVPATLPE